MADPAHVPAPGSAENMENTIPENLRCNGVYPEERFLAIMELMPDLDPVDAQLKKRVVECLARLAWPELWLPGSLWRSTLRKCMDLLRKNERPSRFHTLVFIMIFRINNNSLNWVPSKLKAEYAAAGYDILDVLSKGKLPEDTTPAAKDNGPASMASGAAHGLKRQGSALSDPRPKKVRVAVDESAEDNEERDRGIDGLENHVTSITQLLLNQHEDNMRRIQYMEESGNTLKDINKSIAELKLPQQLQAMAEQLRVFRKFEVMEKELEAMKKEREEEKKEFETTKKELEAMKKKREEEKKLFGAISQEIDALMKKSESVKERGTEKKLEAEKTTIQTRINELEARKKGLDAVKKELDAKKERLVAEDQERDARDKGLNARKDGLDAREEGLDAREKGYHARVKELDAREEGLNAKSAEEKR